jgi:cell division protein FtsI/penicillin-binding protein 2
LETSVVNDILSKNLKGVSAAKTWARSYPEANIGGQIIGFVRMDDATGMGEGVYGLEGSFNDVLAGRSGFISAQKDAGGRRLMLDGGKMRYAVNGSDIVLTIDRTIQHEVCARVKAAVETYQAQSGTVVVMQPDTGAIIAMCSWPDFDPAAYGETKEISAFNNPATYGAYEPGSVFKPITMAIGVERGKVGPNTTYTDPGVEKIDTFEIKNSDEQAHGVQTMRQVLEKSLNTGTIFVERLLGRDGFRAGVEEFGFGEKTGIELSPESTGNISSLKKQAEVYGATASFGQGITVTPIQLATSFAAIANGGRLLRPYIVDEIVYPDGQRKRTELKEISRPISARTSELMKGMLVSVVERGHGASAGVPGYFVAGKTGTAQVANSRGAGYLEGAIISTFAGFAPANDPAFVMVVKIDRPKVGKWAEVNASPLFKELSSFILSYLEIPMERDVNAPTEIESVPDLPVEAAAGAPDVVSVDTGAGVKSEEGVQNENLLEDQAPPSSPATSTQTESSP